MLDLNEQKNTSVSSPLSCLPVYAPDAEGQ